MALVINTAPTIEPVTVSDVASHLRIDSDDENVLLSSYIKVARDYCEAFQNRCYLTTTWELWLDDWPSKDYIEIPRPPLASVSSIKYYDTDDTEATFSSDSYFVDTKSEPGRICLNYGESWPSTALRDHNGICITFIAGKTSPDDVSKNVWLSILLLVGDYYRNREAGTASKETIQAVERLLWLERVL